MNDLTEKSLLEDLKKRVLLARMAEGLGKRLDEVVRDLARRVSKRRKLAYRLNQYAENARFIAGGIDAFHASVTGLRAEIVQLLKEREERRPGPAYEKCYEERVVALQETIRRLLDKLTAKQKECGEMRDTLAAVLKEKSAMREQFDTVRKGCDALRETLLARTKLVIDLRTELDALRKERDALHEALAGARTQIEGLQNETYRLIHGPNYKDEMRDGERTTQVATLDNPATRMTMGESGK